LAPKFRYAEYHYFSAIQRKILTPNDFTDLNDIAARLIAFERRYEHSRRHQGAGGRDR
jgi:hypothetical protein